MYKIIIFLIVTSAFVVNVHSAIPCTFDSECMVYGYQYKCMYGQCQLGYQAGPQVQCYQDVNCYTKGIYYKCKNNTCVSSNNKICLTDSDCKKNKVNRYCRNNHCNWYR